MLTGRFGDTSGRPYIEGNLSLPQRGIAGNVSFLVDTGADRSVLMPLDARRLAIDYTAFDNETTCTGIGGSAASFLEPAVIAFTDGIAIYMYQVEIMILKPKRGLMKMPSIVGRDVLHRLVIRYDFANSRLEMDNRTADAIMAVPRSCNLQ